MSETFEESILATLPGDVAVGHTRYSTTGSTVLANAQPCNVATRCGPLAIAHNGNIINATELKRELVDKGAIFTTSSDTEVLVHLIARKCGTDVAAEASDRAAKLMDAPGTPGDAAFREGLVVFDAWLRADGHRRNPGTTADLITASLFVALRQNIIQLPLAHPFAAAPPG